MKFLKQLFDANREPDKKPSISVDISSQAHFDRGVDLDNAGNVQGAIQEYTKAIELNNHPMAYYCRACVYQDLQKYKDALKDFKSYIKYGPEKTPENIASRVCIKELEQKLHKKH